MKVLGEALETLSRQDLQILCATGRFLLATAKDRFSDSTRAFNKRDIR